jgi:hypothetical protein
MSGPLQATKPVQRLMKVVLSNGSMIQMPTPALKTRAYLATQVSRMIDPGAKLLLCRAVRSDTLVLKC